MFIKGQDSNIIFPLTDKGLFKGSIYSEDVYVKGKYYGSNIYGRRLFKTYFLGHYEEDEAEMVIDEIFTMLKAGEQFYKMPAPTADLEDLGVFL